MNNGSLKELHVPKDFKSYKDQNILDIPKNLWFNVMKMFITHHCHFIIFKRVLVAIETQLILFEAIDIEVMATKTLSTGLKLSVMMVTCSSAYFISCMCLKPQNYCSSYTVSCKTHTHTHTYVHVHTYMYL